VAHREPSIPRWPAVLALVVVLLSIAYANFGTEHEEPPLPLAAVVPIPPPQNPLLHVPDGPPLSASEDSGIELHEKITPPLGSSQALDAGQDSDLAAKESYMRRWRDAMMPLLLPKPRKQVANIIGVRNREQSERNEIDAGVELCTPGWNQLPLARPNPVLDFVVAVDTSGSMLMLLKPISKWLAEFEMALAKNNIDYRLIVLAEQRSFGSRIQLDAGVQQAAIGSHDILDVLISSASNNAPKWNRLLRSGSALQLILITDDTTTMDVDADYLKRLTSELGAQRNFTVHTLGGFGLQEKPVIGFEAPISTTKCPQGINAGIPYQQLSIQTKGMRASICYEQTRAALLTALVSLKEAKAQCSMWLSPKAIVQSARIYKLGEPSSYLTREGLEALCENKKRNYFVQNGVFSLCAQTCQTLAADGFGVEVEVSCR
jgi:hypothetical protein